MDMEIPVSENELINAPAGIPGPVTVMPSANPFLEEVKELPVNNVPVGRLMFVPLKISGG
jgi:hypothetical protein